MKTVSAKELRQNLDSILDRSLAGEQIIVKHRFKEPVVISAYHAKSASKKVSGLDKILRVSKNIKIAEKHRSGDLKKTYSNEIGRKYIGK